MNREFRLIGKGLYSVPEARRLTGIPGPTVNRWVKGYVRRRDGEPVEYDALIKPSLPTVDDKIAISFRDLMELRFVDKLRRRGISWAEIRGTIDAARELLHTDRPFGTRRFKTDGKRLFSEITGKPGLLLRVRTNQVTFEEVFSPELFAEIEYEADEPVRWRPAAGGKVVVLDPDRSFGKPIVDEYGIPTAVLAKAVAAEDSVERVADWYEIPDDVVRAAVAFERQLAA